MLLEFYIIFFFFFFCLCLSVILYFFSYFFIQKVNTIEKISIYECGFDPFEDSRQKFDVKFYLVALLFIVFDLEISFLFPWCVVLVNITKFGFFIMMIFLLILLVGFIYEWKKGGLDW